jgi:hypothetical protein
MTIDMKKLEDLVSWVETVNEEFARCNQEIYGDSRAWHTVYHDPAITNDRVYDWVKVCQGLYNLDNSVANNRAMSDIEDVEKYLNKYWNKPRCFDKGIGRFRHQPCFKGFMEIKDLVNRVTGYKPPPINKKPPSDDLTPFERLFDIQ